MPQNELFLDPDSINYDVYGPDFRNRANGKVVIFGLPKCGNTWLQSMLVNYFETHAVLRLEEVDRQGVLSIHDPFHESMPEREDFANGVVLIRDIRDIIVSYYHYGKTKQFREEMTRFYYEDFDSFYFEWFLSRFVPSHRMFRFADEYAERGVPVLRYERLNQDPAGELSRLIKRWGMAVEPDRVSACVEAHSLDRLKKVGISLTDEHHIEPSHFRKGGWGGFLDEMPSHILADVNQRFASYLKRWGYPPESDPESLDAYRRGLQAVCNREDG